MPMPPTVFQNNRGFKAGIDSSDFFNSGYAVNGQATEILQRGCNGFMQKPFSISVLSQKVREVLEPLEDLKI